MSDCSITPEFCRSTRANRTEFLDLVEPARPALFAKCREIADTAFEAEEFAQKALKRAWHHLSVRSLSGDPVEPEALLLRNLEFAFIESGGGEVGDLGLLDRFIDSFNARDLEGVAGLFSEDAEAEILGILHESGRETIRDGSMRHTILDQDGAPLPDGDPRAENAVVDEEPVVFLWYRMELDGEEVDGLGDILRFEVEGDAIIRLRYYYFSPEVLTEIAGAIGAHVRTNGYRY